MRSTSPLGVQSKIMLSPKTLDHETFSARYCKSKLVKTSSYAIISTRQGGFLRALPAQ